MNDDGKSDMNEVIANNQPDQITKENMQLTG